MIKVKFALNKLNESFEIKCLSIDLWQFISSDLEMLIVSLEVV